MEASTEKPPSLSHARMSRAASGSSKPVDSTVLPGFWIDTSWLWQEPLPEGFPLLQQLLRP
jgi:hypothetical protein